ncbi:MAG: ABC transporter permease [Lachnospiraceae bacterium]|nr:ABC transporter permease [Lachnospiraceae bacterium]
MKNERSFLSSFNGMGVLSSVIAVLIGLFAGLIILLLSNPSQGFAGFIIVLTGGFSDLFNLGQVLYYATPIIMTGLSVGFAGKTGLFNIGASGQFTFGMYAAILVAVRLSHLPGPILCIAALLAGLAAGALWGFVPGLLKALCNVHEVIACIMMNYIGMYLVNYLIVVTEIYDRNKNMTTSVPSRVNLPTLGLDTLFSAATTGGAVRPSSVGSGILIAVITCIFIYIILEKTKFGYELKSCGYNREAAHYAGINEKKGIMLSMAIAGGLAGLGGAMLALAGAGRGIKVVDVLVPEGFMGIPVALLAFNNPLGIIFTGFLIAYLSQSGFLLQRLAFAPEIIEIIIAIIIYFSALALLLQGVIQYFMRGKKQKMKVTAEESNGESNRGDKVPERGESQ